MKKTIVLCGFLAALSLNLDLARAQDSNTHEKHKTEVTDKKPKEKLNTEKENIDPMEGLNRKTFAVNNFVFSKVLRPIGRGYVYVTPKVIRNRVSDFVTIWGYPQDIIINLIDGEFSQSWRGLQRFSFSVIFGAFGLFDISEYTDKSKIAYKDASFSNLLRDNGMPQYAYFEMPFMGGASLRGHLATTLDFITGDFITNSMDIEILKESQIIGIVKGTIQDNGENADFFDDLEKNSADFYITVRTNNLKAEETKGRENEIIENNIDSEEFEEDEDEDLDF